MTHRIELQCDCPLEFDRIGFTRVIDAFYNEKSLFWMTAIYAPRHLGLETPFVERRDVFSMTDHVDTDRLLGLESWEPEALANQLVEASRDGRALHLRGVGSSRVRRDLGEVRRHVVQHGGLVFALDPVGSRGANSTFREAVLEFARTVEQQGELDAPTRRLVDFLSSTRDSKEGLHRNSPDNRTVQHALSRLWTSLSRSIPAYLFVFHPSQATESERAILEHLVEGFVADPVAELVPDVESGARMQGAVVLVDPSSELPLEIASSSIESLDLTEGSRETVRDYLHRKGVVDKLVASTGGDPERLEALMESLPSDCTNFWRYRYRQLDDHEKHIVDVLAVADEPLSVDHLEGVLERLEVSERFSRSVRRLSDEGFLHRNIGDGAVHLRLEDPAFGDRLSEQLDDTRRTRIHRWLADVARRGRRGPDESFLARHYLAAGDDAKGFEHGMRAARRLHGEHALDEARDLFETLLPRAPDDEARREIRHYLLDVCASLERTEEALAHARELESQIDDETERRRLSCRKARLLSHIDERELARETFREARAPEADADNPSVLYWEATIGLGETKYGEGNLDAAVSHAREALDHLEHTSQHDDRRHNRALLEARNLLGKVAILRSDIERARELFRHNRTLAEHWGWQTEVDRADANLALVAFQTGDTARAIRLHEEICERTSRPDVIPRAKLLINLGICFHQEGKWDEALSRYREAVRAARRLGREPVYGLTLYNLATLYLDMGACDRALALAEHIEHEQLDQHRYLMVGSAPALLRAQVAFARSNFADMLEAMSTLESEHDEGGAAAPEYLCRARVVYAHVQLEQYEAARNALDRLESLDPRVDTERFDALLDMGRVALALETDGELDEAEALSRGASETLYREGHPRDGLRASLMRSRLLEREGRDEEARRVIESALERLQTSLERIPPDHRDAFVSLPLHRHLVSRARACDESVPEALSTPARKEEPEQEESPAREDDDTVDLAFRRWRRRYRHIVGEDDRLLEVFRRIDQVADSESPVLIQGESGTGKELIAEAVHEQSVVDDEEAPFVQVNCGAFVDNLLLSELFGHEKGAFTGAVEEKTGRFERADGGTIFLDEIGEISAKAQVALLRVLQEGEFERVGGTETRTADVRLVCATNRDLEQMVESGEFRLDLYYRLKRVLLELPPLRERPQDIPRLVSHFVGEFASDEDEAVSFRRDVLECLTSYSWPGNVRELKNFVRSILLFTEGETVTMDEVRQFQDFFAEGETDLETPEIDYTATARDYEDVDDASIGAEARAWNDPEDALVEEIVSDERTLSELQDRLEHESIRRALIETGGNITQAADILDMTRPRLSQIVNGDERLVELKQELVG